MAQYTTPGGYEHQDVAEEHIASPGPLGFSVLAFATAIIGCFYAGFIIPFEMIAIRPGVGAVALASGIVLILAGMWEFRKDNTEAATVFTSYGGFLILLGMIFMPNFGVFSALVISGLLYVTLGLFFLCWTIFTAVLLIGSLGKSMGLVATLGLLFLSYIFLTIGQLAANNGPLLRIGGWLSIICALVAWYVAVASMQHLEPSQRGLKVPFGQMASAE